ncbi:hypothetical protein [Deinococcus sp. UYEF24]
MFGTDLHAFIPTLMLFLHGLLNGTLFGEYSNLVWAGVRGTVAVFTFITARAVRDSPDRYLVWVTIALGSWLGLKVADDLFFISQGTKLNPYFLVSNMLWCAALVGMARMANRERVWRKGAL